MRRLVLMALLGLPIQATAYTSGGVANHVRSFVTEGEVYVDRTRREQLAAAMQVYWGDIAKRLPRLSPGERDWLTQELAATDQSRRDRVEESREYHLAQLEQIVEQCTQSTQNILSPVTEAAEIGLEMLYWTDIATCYHNSFRGLAKHLDGAELDSEMDPEDGHFLDADILSDVLTVVIPSAMSDQMDWELKVQ